MRYLLTVLLTVFTIWLGAMLWLHFPAEGAFGAALVLPIVFTFIAIKTE